MSRPNDRHVIWSDVNLDFEDWKDDLKEDYPDLSEDELVQKMYELNNEYLNDERANLNIQLSQPILIIADIGRWNGRFNGYGEIQSGILKIAFTPSWIVLNGMWISTATFVLMQFITMAQTTISIVCIKIMQPKHRLITLKPKYMKAKQQEPI